MRRFTGASMPAARCAEARRHPGPTLRTWRNRRSLSRGAFHDEVIRDRRHARPSEAGGRRHGDRWAPQMDEPPGSGFPGNESYRRARCAEAPPRSHCWPRHRQWRISGYPDQSDFPWWPHAPADALARRRLSLCRAILTKADIGSTPLPGGTPIFFGRLDSKRQLSRDDRLSYRRCKMSFNFLYIRCRTGRDRCSCGEQDLKRRMFCHKTQQVCCGISAHAGTVRAGAAI